MIYILDTIKRSYFYQTIPPYIDTTQTRTRYLLLAFLMVSLLLGLFSLNVLQNGIVTAWNMPVYHFMQTLHSPILDRLCLEVSHVKPSVLNPFWIGMTIRLLFRKDTWRTIHWIMLGIVFFATIESLKFGMAIPRPIDTTAMGRSFPSAHVAAHATILGGFILLLNIHHNTSRWIPAVTYISYGLWISLMAFSRLYLGAHWFTDIIGALLVSLSILLLFSLSYYQRQVPPLLRRKQLVLVGLATLVLMILLTRYILQ